MWSYQQDAYCARVIKNNVHATDFLQTQSASPHAPSSLLYNKRTNRSIWSNVTCQTAKQPRLTVAIVWHQ